MSVSVYLVYVYVCVCVCVLVVVVGDSCCSAMLSMVCSVKTTFDCLNGALAS